MEGTIRYGQSKDTGHTGHNTQGDNLKIHATLDTIHRMKTNKKKPTEN